MRRSWYSGIVDSDREGNGRVVTVRTFPRSGDAMPRRTQGRSE